MGKVYVGDTGTEITLNVGLDTSTATTVKIMARKPSGEIVEWEAAPAVIDGETVGLSYTVEAGDLDEAGMWRLQAFVSRSNWSGLGETAEMRVWPAYG